MLMGQPSNFSIEVLKESQLAPSKKTPWFVVPFEPIVGSENWGQTRTRYGMIMLLLVSGCFGQNLQVIDGERYLHRKQT